MHRSMLVGATLVTVAIVALLVALSAPEDQPELSVDGTMPMTMETPATSDPTKAPPVAASPFPEPNQAPPVLSLPAPRSMPFSNVLEPATFDELWVIDDSAHGYTADGPQYFLAHTHTQGGAVGNAVNEAGLTPGTVIEIAGDRYEVTGVMTVAKPDIGTLPMWQASDPDDAFLVVCLWNNGVRATHNLVIELHRS